METTKRIAELSNNELLSVYHGFINFVIIKLKIDPMEVLKNLPKELKNEDEIKSLTEVEPEKLDTRVDTTEVLPVAKEQLFQWAKNPGVAPLLDKYLDSNTIKPMAAGAILAFGAVLLMTIVSTSIKVEKKNGITSFSYSSENISDNAVELVKAVMSKVPDTIQHIYSKIKS